MRRLLPVLLTGLSFLTPWLPLAAAQPLAQDYMLVFRNPNPEFYVEGPGLTRLEDGTLVAIVPGVPRVQWSEERRATQSVVHILRSQDGGKSWQEPRTASGGRGLVRRSAESLRLAHL
ncbi:sialidase family protein [Verrucomicrobium spinosum]|uniref:sialidase family protein n=1 Tax=Verrucomicrobium spinosum TaxID=2736 RepID=UPI0002DA72CB|nr:sialidase family protein [Verrucomicrobium spinosum]